MVHLEQRSSVTKIWAKDQIQETFMNDFSRAQAFMGPCPISALTHLVPKTFKGDSTFMVKPFLG